MVDKGPAWIEVGKFYLLKKRFNLVAVVQPARTLSAGEYYILENQKGGKHWLTIEKCKKPDGYPYYPVNLLTVTANSTLIDFEAEPDIDYSGPIAQ